MEYRALGATDENIAVLGFGAWPLAGMMGFVDRSQATSLIREAIDSGVTFIDTAEGYGDSEELLGNALGDGYREKCFLATKVSQDFTQEGVKKAVQNSLKALRTDRIDLYQVHRYDPGVALEETLGAISRLKEAGFIRYVGVSNFTVEQLGRAKKILTVVSNQINYNSLNRSPKQHMLPYCRQEKIAVLAHSSLAKGLLGGRYQPTHTFASDDERSSFPGYSGELFAEYLAVVEELKGVAEEEGLSIAQAALAWLLAQEGVTSVLIGPKNRSQLEESAHVIEATGSQRRIELRKRMNDILERYELPPLCPFPDQLV